MLLRHDPEGVVAIAQPAHAWVAGQIAQAWGNAQFPRPDPFEEVCLAIEQHDIGWLDEDRSAPWDAKTGLPREFWNVPAVRHTALWSAGVERAGLISRYAALLISLHGVSIYDLTFDQAKASKENVDAVTRFRAEQGTLQDSLFASLRSDPSFTAHATKAAIDRNRRLLLALDTLSLHLCWGLDREIEIEDVPAAAGEGRRISLQPSPNAFGQVVIRPWPFHASSLVVRVEGRRLRGPQYDGNVQSAAWHAAVPVALDFVLVSEL